MPENFDLLRFFHENTKRNVYYTIGEPDINKKPSIFKEYPDSRRIQLPKNSFNLQLSLGKSILNRRSCRDFSDKSLSCEKLSKLLWFGYGITDTITYENFEIPCRPAPSGGALYPCEIYLAIFNVNGVGNGIYHYCSIDHSLELLKLGDFESRLAQLFMGQFYIANSSICIIITSILERITWKYGARGYRYLLMEVGHITQNFCLAAAAQGLDSLPLGGFYDNPLARFIGVDPNCEPVQYGLAIGYKTERKDL